MRFYNYALVIVGMVLILNVAVIQTPVTGSLLGWLGLTNGSEIVIQNIKDSTGWDRLTYLLITSVTAGVVLGAFGRTPDVRFITAGIIFAITAALVADLVSIIILINSAGGLGGVLSSIFNIIGVGAVVGLFITAISYWQNPD